jgi:Histidine kinase-, DNA gyrase B-, and HSP90-like ATPase
VLGGDRPARRWQRPIPLVSVLRGAMSRITEYRRVEIGPLPDRFGVDGGAVEALVHALAELLDNATRYSAPDTRVRLGARALDGGIVIEVVDAGVGLTREAAERADLVLRTREFGLELASLGESPRLGLAVVGRLAHAAGFEASLHPVPGGGLCARLRVPAGLLRELPEADLAPVKPDQRPHSHRAAQPGGTRAESSPTGLTSHGLPQRRRRVPEPATQDAAAPAAATPGAATQDSNTNTGPGAGARQGTGVGRPAAAAGAAPAPGLWLSAFQAGLRGESGDGASRADGREPE